jgi:hypothetical protein
MRRRDGETCRLGNDRRVGASGPAASTAAVPSLSNSSSVTAVIMTSPLSAPGVDATRAAAAHIAATPDFMSVEPRP